MTTEFIMYGFGETPLGRVLVASSAEGICAVLLGDSEAELTDDLQRRFPSAGLVAGESDMTGVVAAVVAYIQDPRQPFDLPLDVRGTEFQKRGWAELRTIPPGATVSYAELAERAGTPAATRAVASACGANAIAVVIPCHRVVRANGALSGYRWGVDRKRDLLELERSLAGSRQSGGATNG